VIKNLHPHSTDYFSAKFCFFRSLHCWTSSWRKITYSITHSLIEWVGDRVHDTQSLTQLIWCPGNQSACASENTNMLHWRLSR